MAFELEALVGHLYVAGGRTIRTNPPGALVEAAPRSAARGREIDTFFALVLPSGTFAPNTFYEQMSLMAAERYFSSSGSVTSVLREVLNTLNHNLFEHNRSGRRHYEAHMFCAVLRGEELYVARVGAATMLMWQGGEITSLPDPLTNDDALFKPPLGVQPIPEVEMKRFNVAQGTRLLFSDANLVELTEEKIQSSMTEPDIEQVLDAFKLAVTLQIQLMAVEFVLPDESILLPAATGQSTAVLQAEIAAARTKLAPTATAEADAPAVEAQSSNTVQKRTKQAAVSASNSAGHSMIAIGDILSKIFGRNISPEKQRRRRAAFTTMAFSFPVTIVLIVMLSWVGGVGTTAFEECVGRAMDAANLARGLDSTNPGGVMAAWQGTLRIVEEDCQGLRPENQDPTLTALRQEALRVIDGLNDITRRSTDLLHAFPSGASIEQLVLQGLDMYAFDEANNLVYRMQLAGDGYALASLPQVITSMRIGAAVDGFTVGDLIDIDFDGERNRIVALDVNGVFVSCGPQFINDCDAQRVVGSELWGNPVGIDMWQGRLYVLDSGTEQLWRYDPTGDRFPAGPVEYFTSALRPSMTDAVDFEISGNGTVYILTALGVMRSYYLGQPNDFLFQDFREGQELTTVGAEALYLSNNPIAQVFLIASPRARSIYETTLAGTHMTTFRVSDDALLERLSDVTADIGESIVYAASGNAVFAFEKETQ